MNLVTTTSLQQHNSSLISGMDNLTLSCKQQTKFFQLCNTDSSPFLYTFMFGEQGKETGPASS